MTPTRAATPREKVSRPAIGGVRVSMSLQGRDKGPSAVLPYLVRIMGEVGELDRVHVEDDRMAAEGARWLAGQGRLFEARATLHPVAGAVPRWDVTLDVRLVRGPKLEAGAAVSVWLEPGLDPGWLIPGLFYGENRPAESEARYPRFVADAALETPGNDPFAASAWSFRADRAATPVVWATDGQVGAALATTEASEAGPTGLGFAADPARTEISLFFPFREEPVTYVGSAIPALSDVRMHSWTPGRWVRLEFRVYLGEPRHDAFTPVLRDLHRWLAAKSPMAPWVAVPVAADLAAEGLLRWHYRPEAPALYETAAFERHFDGRADEHGDRAAMHVAWLSGAPPAYALLAHGRRTNRPAAVTAGRQVLDAIASNLAPCGTFWGQWTATGGWSKGWTPGDDRLHTRTLAEAALFMTRAVRLEELAGVEASDTTSWRRAVGSNLEFISARQRSDGAIPSAWHARTGEIESWAGSAGVAWVPALIEASRIFERPAWRDAAARAGTWYARDVDAGFLFGAPEDVDLGPTSEDGYVAVMAYVALAESEPDPMARERWLAVARSAADWMLTFRYTYNVRFDPQTLLGRYDFRSRGADQASPANQHLHAYGLICLPEMVRLARMTGDDHFLERTRENMACFRQFVARIDGDFNARRGMAPERYYQTNCFGPKGAIGPLSHAWCLGLLLYAADAAADLPELSEGADGS